MAANNRVCYFYDPEVGNYYYGQGHPMKPHRIRMAHNLILNYGLYKKMFIYKPQPTTPRELTKFHTDDYVNFMRTVSPENMHEFSKQLQRFNVGEDCPVFHGMFQFSQLSAGGSIGSAVKLNHHDADIAINWAGGLHHAKKSEASGFCYINDIVLGILELLKYHKRVLYVDIDIHHGDGVEEAFYCSNRVMTVSFHKFGEYFPGTGDIRDVGAFDGKNYAINFPLKEGIDDISYEQIFKPLMQRVMDWYQPEAIVLQCGADSLSGDRLGCFNLSLKGHAQCVEFLKSFGKPMMVLGGGGYTIRNVSRCWTFETAVVLDTPIDNRLPYNEYIEYYGPDYNLHIEPSNMSNLNTRDMLERSLQQLMENLRHIEGAPSVEQVQRPPDMLRDLHDRDEDKMDAESRHPDAGNRRPSHPAEMSDSDDDDDKRRNEGWEDRERTSGGGSQSPFDVRVQLKNKGGNTAEFGGAAPAAPSTTTPSAAASAGSGAAPVEDPMDQD